jgi:hypothetical protein
MAKAPNQVTRLSRELLALLEEALQEAQAGTKGCKEGVEHVEGLCEAMLVSV